MTLLSLAAAVASTVQARVALDPTTAATLAESAVKLALDQLVARHGGTAEAYVLSHAPQVHLIASDGLLDFVAHLAARLETVPPAAPQ